MVAPWLEGHYRTGHYPCLHPECLAKKFVVFTSPHELKNHEGLEHGGAMSKAGKYRWMMIATSSATFQTLHHAINPRVYWIKLGLSSGFRLPQQCVLMPLN